jgi:hypothetical protein
MKTCVLVVGLVELLGAAACAYAGFVFHSPALIVLMAACGFVNGFCGAGNVMDALFGADGLVLDAERVAARDNARDDRAVPPARRGPRFVHPSARLRARGAVKRLRVSPAVRPAVARLAGRG